MPKNGFTKKQIAACEKSFIDARKTLVSLRATTNDLQAWHEFTIQTKCGELGVNLKAGTHLHSIFCRFKEPKRAEKFFGVSNYHNHVNPFSGKWNFHGDDGQALVTDFLFELKQILEIK